MLCDQRTGNLKLTSPPQRLVCVTLVAGYAGSLYFTYFFHPQFTRYPEPIAKALRKALYYSNYNPDPKRALKYYRQALELCDELQLDHFSDEVMGIKIQLAAWLEKVESYEGAAKVLDVLLEDCKRWVAAMEAAAKDGSLAKFMPVSLPAEPNASSPAAAEAAETPETAWGKRTRILGKAVGISVKLASLYSDEHMLEHDLAHERLVWAVETLLAELQRRKVEGVKDGEGAWMTPEEIGGALECECRQLPPRTCHMSLTLPRSPWPQLRTQVAVPPCPSTLLPGPPNERQPVS